MSKKKWDEFTPMEQLAVVQALYKAIGDKVSTKNPDSLRSSVDAQVKGFYKMTGAKSYDISLMGEKVGTMSVTTKDGDTKTVYDLDDWDKVEGWCQTEDGYQMLMEYCFDNPQKFIEYVVKNTGEIPDGVNVRNVEVPGGIKDTMLRVDSSKVSHAMGNQLAPTVVGLLEG